MPVMFDSVCCWFADSNITGFIPVLLVFGSTGCFLKIIYEKPKHAGACNAFILFLTFLVILNVWHYIVLTFNLISALVGIE